MNLSQLPQAVIDAVDPLFEAHPLDQALGRLVVTSRGPDVLTDRVERVTRHAAAGPDSPLAAGLWLYVDELDRSHRISQRIDTPTGSYWHAIMHRLEGDFSNSHYWLRKTGRHPAMDEVDVTGLKVVSYDPGKLVDAAAAAWAEGQAPGDLIILQRREWWALFAWCAREGA